jgi:hypothetical protein
LAAVHGVATVVDLDSVTTSLLEAVAKQFDVAFDLDLPPLRDLRSARYQCLAHVVDDNLKAGGTVIAIAPFSAEAADAARWRDWCRSLGAEKIDLCWLDVEPAEALRRVAQRQAARDQLKTVDGAGGDRTIDRAPVDRTALDLVIDVSNRSAGEVAAELAVHLGWKPLTEHQPTAAHSPDDTSP